MARFIHFIRLRSNQIPGYLPLFAERSVLVGPYSRIPPRQRIPVEGAQPRPRLGFWDGRAVRCVKQRFENLEIFSKMDTESNAWGKKIFAPAMPSTNHNRETGFVLPCQRHLPILSERLTARASRTGCHANARRQNTAPRTPSTSLPSISFTRR